MYFADLVGIYRSEIAELAGLGCSYLQLDDTALPCNCDADVRAGVRRRAKILIVLPAATLSCSTTRSRSGRRI